MLDYHIEKESDVSISVIEVPWDEASRFGIMNTNEEMEIVEFEEKPQFQEVILHQWESIFLIGQF